MQLFCSNFTLTTRILCVHKNLLGKIFTLMMATRYFVAIVFFTTWHTAIAGQQRGLRVRFILSHTPDILRHLLSAGALRYSCTCRCVNLCLPWCMTSTASVGRRDGRVRSRCWCEALPWQGEEKYGYLNYANRDKENHDTPLTCSEFASRHNK